MKLQEPDKNEMSLDISFVPVTNFHGIPKLIPSKLTGSPPAPLYLSNVQDEALLLSASHRAKLAGAMLRAIDGYFTVTVASGKS